MSHTKAFLNHIEYQNFINGGEGKVCMPNVSVCEAEYEVHYNDDGTVDHCSDTSGETGTTYSYTITYRYKTSSAETTDETVTVTGMSSDVTFTAKSAPATPVTEYEFIGWSTVEIPTRSEVEQSGFIIEPGDSMVTDEDVVLYANYEITVKGLIDAGYATMSYNGGINTIEILSACPYNALLVSDWQEVSLNQKKIEYVVPSGEQEPYYRDNIILWNHKKPEGWTDNDLYSWYNNKTVPTKPGAAIFWALNGIDNFSITFNGASWSAPDYPWGTYQGEGIFSPRYKGAQEEYYSESGFRNTPKNVTVTINGDYSSIAQVMFSEMQQTTALTLNCGIFSCHEVVGMFEFCYRLQTLNINGSFRWDAIRTCHNVFQECGSLTSIPYVTAWGRDSVYNTLYPRFDGTRGTSNCSNIFRGMNSLTFLGPRINMNCISLSGCTAEGYNQEALGGIMFECPELTDVRIINLNNNDWNFSNKTTKTYIPKMNTTSIEYVIANAADCTANPHTVVFNGNGILTYYQSSGDGYYIPTSSDPLYHLLADGTAKGWNVRFVMEA